MKNLRILIYVMFFLGFVTSYAQNYAVAKAYYEKAKEEFELGNYSKSLDYVSKTKLEINSTNPDIMYLEVVNLFEINIKDTRIEKVGLEFLNKAQKNDTRIKVVSSKIVEHKEAVLADIQREQQHFEKALKLKDVALINSFLKEYPKSKKIETVKKIRSELEIKAYTTAQKTKSIEKYNYFLKYYAESTKVNEIEYLKKEAQELALYTSATNNPATAFNYIQTYPEGKYIKEVKRVYKDYLVAEGNKKFEEKNYTEASAYYNKYQKLFSNKGYGITDEVVKNKLNEIEKIKDKEKRISERKTTLYLMATFTTYKNLYQNYGLQIGKLKTRGVGAYFNLSGNENVLNNITYINEIEGTSGLSTEELESREVAYLSGTFGLTVKIHYPIWVNFGAGVNYFSVYVENEEGLNLLTYPNRKGIDDFSFYPELGLHAKIGKVIVLSFSGQYHLETEFIHFKAGIGFNI